MSIRVTRVRIIKDHGELPDGTKSISFADFGTLIGSLQNGESVRLPAILTRLDHALGGILRLPAGIYRKSADDDLVTFTPRKR